MEQSYGMGPWFLSPPALVVFHCVTREAGARLETKGSCAAGLSEGALSGQDPLVSDILTQEAVTASSSTGVTHMVKSYAQKGPQSPPHLSRLLQKPLLQSSIL